MLVTVTGGNEGVGRVVVIVIPCGDKAVDEETKDKELKEATQTSTDWL